jgi:hypothetical protein
MQRPREVRIVVLGEALFEVSCLPHIRPSLRVYQDLDVIRYRKLLRGKEVAPRAGQLQELFRYVHLHA